ncbi:MFS transporter [Mariniluteicoccus flavus]
MTPTPTAPAAPPAATPALAPLAVGLIAGILATAFEAIAVGTAMPQAARELGRVEWYAWAFSLFVIGMLAGNVAGGRSADRHGAFRPLAAGMVTFAVGLFIAGLAPSMAQLLAGRLVQGIGAGAMNVGLYVVVAHAFPEDRRPVMMTGFSAAWVLPAFIGPPIAAWVTTRFSWHWVFLGILPLIVLAAALAVPPLLRLRRAIPALRGHEAGTPVDPVPVWVGLVLAAAAVALQYAGQRAAATPDLGAGLAAVAGVVLLALAIPRLMPRGFLTGGRGLPAVMASRALAAGAFFAAEAFIPLMLVESRGHSLAGAGIMLTVGASGWFLGSWLQSRPWLPLGRHHMIVLGAVATTVGIAGCAAVAAFPALPVAVAWVLWTFAGLGMGFLIATTGLATMSLSTSAEQGRNASALQSGESLGNSLVTGIAGTVFALLHARGDLPLTFGSVLGLLVAVGVLATVLALRIGPVTPAAREFDSVGPAA